MKYLAKFLALALVASFAVACGDDDDSNNTAGNNGGDDGLTTSAQVSAYLEGKTFLMDGEDIPPAPLGYDENTNFGQATQCYESTELSFTATGVTATSDLGTLENAPNAGDTGTCDNDTVSNTLEFNSNSVVISNVQGDAECFDIDISYGAFAQEGRGSITNDGQTLNLELFFADQVANEQHRCETAGVGENEITLTLSGGAELPVAAGNAVQTYQLQTQ